MPIFFLKKENYLYPNYFFIVNPYITKLVQQATLVLCITYMTKACGHPEQKTLYSLHLLYTCLIFINYFIIYKLKKKSFH